MSDFSQFTRKYSLSKTLRFELKPVGETQKMLDENQVFQRDQYIKEKYIQTKPFIDRLHQDFIQEALANIELQGLSEFENTWKEYKKDKKGNEKLYKKSTENLRKEIKIFFDAKGKDWAEKYASTGLKKDTIDILFEEGIFQVLKRRYGEDPNSYLTNLETGEIYMDTDTERAISIFDGWKGFTGYFTKFFATRENYYKTDGTGTALATRIVDQNLVRYLDNKELFEKYSSKLDLREIETVFPDFAKISTLVFYNDCILEPGIDTYNQILGGYTRDNGEKIKGINEMINAYRQIHKDEKIPFLKKLDRQIGSEKQKLFETIDSEDDFRKVLGIFVKNSSEKISLLQKNLDTLFGQKDPLGIYLSREAINTIGYKWMNAPEVLQMSLYEVLKGGGAKYDKKENEYKFPDFIALSDIRGALQAVPHEGFFWKMRYLQDEENPYGILTTDRELWDGFMTIFQYEFASLLQRFEKNPDEPDEALGYLIAQKNIHTLLQNPTFDPNNSENKIIIKTFADETLRVYQMGKYFSLEKRRSWNPDALELGDFYTRPDGYEAYHTDAYEMIVQKYNDIRNYLTKNPWSEEKWKLNFENPTLANGWDRNKESDNSCILLKKNNRYYLGLMSRGNSQLFDERNEQRFLERIEDGVYEKMVYKFFPDQAKMFPKVCFSAKGLEFFKPSEEIYAIYKNEEFKKGDTFSILSMQKLIDFYKECLTTYDGWKGYTFSHLRKTRDYTENIGEFFRDVAEDGYRVTYKSISQYYIDALISDKKLYLFEIANQDFSDKKTGTKNLHTLYFESLFSRENQEANFPLKLNGQAELFFRPASLPVVTEKRNFVRPITSKKRYTEDKIFFHIPITFNRTEGEARQFNTEINNFLANNPDINIIGIDRGEKHLAYYTIIDQHGVIIKDPITGELVSGSLNIVNGIDYGSKLEQTADRREQARRDWQAVEGIKNLKKGYTSAVVRKLADLAIQHNAIIIFEDLNMRFKQIRGGIEKSVYQQLEKALIDKLSFLVQKGEIDPQKAGHLLSAYQLSAPFESFEKMGKQTGIVFYTQAAYTSKIDPFTGWRPHLYLKYENAHKAQKDILKFTKVIWNAHDTRFEFMYDIEIFSPSQKEYPKQKIWTICSSVERYRWDKSLNQNKGDYVHYSDMTQEFTRLFASMNIDVTRDIRDQIGKIDPKGNEKFFKSFMFLFGLVCQIRNTNKKASDANHQDFLLSPVVPFFDTRNLLNEAKGLPRNGDENGSFNIARKGLLLLNKINHFNMENGNCDTMKWSDLTITNREWDNFSKI